MAEETKQAIEQLAMLTESNPTAKAYLEGLAKGLEIQKEVAKDVPQK